FSRDWSSDVCSSDLFSNADLGVGHLLAFLGLEPALAVGRDFQPAAHETAFIARAGGVIVTQGDQATFVIEGGANEAARVQLVDGACGWFLDQEGLDRKSTRLNSSHVKISYAVFCLK